MHIINVQKLSFLFFFFLILNACQSRNKTDTRSQESVKRFFNDDSFWNQPIPKNAELDAKNDYWISLLERDPSGENVGVNVHKYTIPIYEVNSTEISFQKIKTLPSIEWYDKDMIFRHEPEFDSIGVPIQDYMTASGGADQHIAIVDWKANRAWDMFYVQHLEDGTWQSATGMTYPLDGSGAFNKSDFDVKLGESIHSYGPGVAAGTPIIAGVIRYDEVKSGEIRHKIAGALRFVAYQEYTYPATWTDGNFKGGIPEGAVVQLDPELDITQFGLTKGELVVAKALQEYGFVVIDFAEATTIRAEYIDDRKDKSWDGIIRGWNKPGGLKTIPVKHYSVLKVNNVQKGGDRMKEFFTKKLYFKDN